MFILTARRERGDAHDDGETASRRQRKFICFEDVPDEVLKEGDEVIKIEREIRECARTVGIQNTRDLLDKVVQRPLRHAQEGEDGGWGMRHRPPSEGAL